MPLIQAQQRKTALFVAAGKGLMAKKKRATTLKKKKKDKTPKTCFLKLLITGILWGSGSLFWTTLTWNSLLEIRKHKTTT